MISPDSTITDIVYSPLTVETTVSKGTHSTTQTIKSNALGETVQIEDDELHEVNYLYYPDGKLKSIFTNVHPSDTIQLEYDIHGNRTMINDPDAGILRSQYDDFSHLIQQITAKGDTIKYDYDKFGRMVQRLDERGNTYYIYESDSTSKAFGKIDSIYCPSEAQSINYNYESTYGRLSSVDERISGKTFTNTFSYDWFGRLMSRTYPAGLITNYSYAENGQMKEITGNGVEVWSCESTNELGQITCFTQGSYGTELEFDAYGVLDEITTGSIFNIKYIHDDAGNIASREDVLTHQKELFSYDNLNQLTKIEYYLNDNHISSSDLELAYGGDGNILSKSDLGLNINYGENTAGPHALTSIEKPVSSYVPPPQIITYTDFNKVSRIIDTIAQDTTISLEFTYGMSNQRVKSILKENNVIKKVKYFSSQFEVDSTANGIKKYNYITSPTGLAAIYVQEGTGNDTLFYTIQDHLGSISVVINQVTDSTQYFSYSSWGQPRDPDDWTLPFEGNLFSARGYTGHEHLLEFNLINMNGRIYDPAIGRFLSPDPFVQNIGNANSFNRYAYCRNNPLSYFDPSGYTYDKPLYNSDDVTWGSENSIGGSQQTPFLPRASFYDPFEYDDPFELVWIDGPNGGAYVSKSDVIIIDFEAFLNDLRSNYETDDFKLTIKLGYNGEIWIVGNNKGAQSSFGGLNTNNFLDYEVATVYATNRGDYELGKELVGVISVWSADAAYVLGVSGQYGQFKSKNGNIYRLGSLGYGVGLDAGVSYMVLGVWANPNTFSPQDLRGWSFNGNISLYVIDIGGEIPLVEKWREWGYEFGDAYIDGGAGPAIPGFGAFFGGSYTWISKKPIN